MTPFSHRHYQIKKSLAFNNFLTSEIDESLHQHYQKNTLSLTTEALIVVYTHLLENKAVATSFVNMSTPHREIWLRTYLAKNYYG
jgi:hypothetical protein